MKKFALPAHCRIIVVSAILIFLFSAKSYSQIFWTESFNNGCSAGCTASGVNTGNGAWTEAITGSEGADPNPWYVSCSENGHTAGVCGSSCTAASATATLACLHIGPSTLTGGDIGAAYDAGGLCGIISCPQTDRRAESPIINCSGQINITLGFNYETFGDPGYDFGRVDYSIDGGITWNVLASPAVTGTCAGGAGIWTAFSTLLPASCNNNPTVKIGFHWVNNDDGLGTDPSFAVDDITLGVGAFGIINTVAPFAAGPYCTCDSISVIYTSVGSYTVGNIFTVELSDASGSFSSPVTIGSIASTALSGNIPCVIPCGAIAGTGYRTRVVSSSPVFTGINNGVNITVNATVVPIATVAPSANPICAGTLVNFFAGAINGGTSPTYQWQVNGANIGGATTGIYSTGTLVNGDLITVILTSNALCAAPGIATSTAIAMIVNSSVVPSVSISFSPSGIISCGTNVTFTATPTGGGATPTYQWQINGVNIPGAISSTFTSNTLVNADVVTVLMTSSAACAGPTTVTSNAVTMVVSAMPPPTITVIGSINSCGIGADTLTASSGYSTYSWNTGPTTQWLIVASAGICTVSVTNSGGCTGSASYTVVSSATTPTDICEVTVDSASHKNLVIWNPPLDPQIDSFLVYKETSTMGVYNQIGAVWYHSFSTFLDTGSYPNIHADRYELGIRDTCGSFSPLSPFHNTIHLTISSGGTNTWNLNWNPYIGFVFGTYNIYRGTSLATMTLLASLSSSNISYTDYTAPSGIVYYQVEAVNTTGCTPMARAPINGARSNIRDNSAFFTGIDNNEINDSFTITPNPSGSFITIELSPINHQASTIHIYNVVEEMVLQSEITSPKTEISISSLPAGVYFVKLQIDDKIINKKLVKE